MVMPDVITERTQAYIYRLRSVREGGQLKGFPCLALRAQAVWSYHRVPTGFPYGEEAGFPPYVTPVDPGFDSLPRSGFCRRGQKEQGSKQRRETKRKQIFFF
jgi:hypothetical protein